MNQYMTAFAPACLAEPQHSPKSNDMAVSPEFQAAKARQRDAVALVIEDEMLVRMVLVDTLMDDGYEVIEAVNGDEALLALSRRPDVDLIISDIEMPGTLNGFALARRVAEQWPDIRMILVSGRAAPRPGDLPAGAEFMPKPFYPEAVLLAANRIIGR